MWNIHNIWKMSYYQKRPFPVFSPDLWWPQYAFVNNDGHSWPDPIKIWEEIWPLNQDGCHVYLVDEAMCHVACHLAMSDGQFPTPSPDTWHYPANQRRKLLPSAILGTSAMHKNNIMSMLRALGIKGMCGTDF